MMHSTLVSSAARISVESDPLHRGTVVRINARGAGENGWAEDVEKPSANLIQLMNQHAAETPKRTMVFVVLTSSSKPGLLEEALLEATRGISGTAALELGPIGGRVDVVVATEKTNEQDVINTVEYLLDEARGGYTTGATLDLRDVLTSPRSTTGTVLVTGAAGGLGFAAAEAIKKSGRNVVLTDRAGEALARAGEKLNAPTIACDLTNKEQLGQLVNSTMLIDMDALVVHHGVGASTRFGAEYDYAASNRSLVLNGTTVYDIVDLLVPSLKAKGGTVVILSSQAGLTAEAGNGPYCAAKFAAVGYSSALAHSLKAKGIAVHALCPGPVDTPLMREAFAGFAAGLGMSAEDFTRERLAAIPLGRAGEPSQIGESTALLLTLHSTNVVLAPTGAETLS